MNDNAPFSIAIIGFGLIGGSLALAIRRARPSVRIIGVSSPGTVSEALSQGVIDEGGTYDDIAGLIPPARLVFLCTPIDRILDMLPVVAESASPGAVITDVGSTKARIVEKANEVMPEGVYFIGGHPMAGSEKSGLSAADPFLFQNALYVLTPTPGVPEDVVNGLALLLSETGARVQRLDPVVHDSVAAAVSHLPQLLSLALVEMVGTLNVDEPAHLLMAAGGFRDMTRIASSPYAMWHDILDTNRDAVWQALGMLGERIDAMRDDLDGRMEDHFTRANAIRSAIPTDTKGFLAPLQDVLVHAEDRPGVLAGMVTALAGADVNIKDIELLKIREGEGGTFRLAFSDADIAMRAVEVLKDAGFPSSLSR